MSAESDRSLSRRDNARFFLCLLLSLAFVFAATIATALLTYDVFVRSTFIGWVLNGRRRDRLMVSWLFGARGGRFWRCLRVPGIFQTHSVKRKRGGGVTDGTRTRNSQNHNLGLYH